MPHITPAPSPETPSGASRRKVLAAVAWAAPVIAFAAAAPAMAASPANQVFGIAFDGGSGTNSLANSVNVNLYSATGSPVTLTAPVTVFIDIVGLNAQARDERSYTITTSFGTVTQGTYNAETRTTRLTWTIPVGEVFNTATSGTGSRNVLIRFNDGASSTIGAGRITNKVVVTGITGGRITKPNPLPIDSSIIKDVRNTISPDGIY